MYLLALTPKEVYDESSERFYSTEGMVLELEHSLRSLYLWESIWNKPFLNDEKKTVEETLSYIRCMTLTPNVSDWVYDLLTAEEIHGVNEYMNRSMTATTFREIPGVNTHPGRKRIITAEIIYYWMFRAGIPLEWENRHLNQLLTMIRVCNEKDSPPKKMSKKDALAQRRALNESRKSKYNTRG